MRKLNSPTERRDVDVSVVIPTRDRWNWLRSSVRSAHEQIDVRVELIVVDDGSLAPPSYALPDMVRLIRCDPPRGPVGARNRGLEEAGAPWVAFLDDDDLWSPTKLRDQLAAVDRPRTGFVYSHALVTDAALEPLWSAVAPEPDRLLDALLHRSAIPAGASNVLARRDLLIEADGFDPAFRHLDDWDLWIRLAALAPAALHDAIAVAYRLHGAGQIVHESQGAPMDFARLASKHARLSRNRGVSFDVAHHYRWMAQGHARARRRAAAARAYAHSAVIGRRPTDILRASAALTGRSGPRRAVRRAQSPDWLVAARNAERA